MLHEERREGSAANVLVHPRPGALCRPGAALNTKELAMHQIIYIVGAIVIVIALLSFVGLR